MHRADTGAGQHGIGGLRNHRQVNRDSVAGFDAVVFQHVGEFGNVVVQVVIGDVFGLGRVITLPDDGRLVAALGKVTVNTVVGDIGEAILEPFDRDVVRIIGRVLGLCVRLEPIYPAAVFRPEFFGITNRGRIHFLVFRRINVGALLPCLRDGIDLV